MRSRRNAEAPIIIKRGKKCKPEEHGGNWKVALADFMTSMFIFTLAMWLLNITTKEQKMGIADFFSPSAVSQVQSGSGGVLGGRSIVADGTFEFAGGPPAVIAGRPLYDFDLPELMDTLAGRQLTEEEIMEILAAWEEARLSQAAEGLGEAMEDVPLLSETLGAGQLQVTQRENEIIISLQEAEGKPMFNSGSAVPLGTTRQVLQELVPFINDAAAANNGLVKVKGHTDAVPFAGGEGGYSNWELSADRANAARRVLVNSGLQPDLVTEVVGLADSEPRKGEDGAPIDAMDASNRRLEIVIVGNQASAAIQAMRNGQPMPRGFTRRQPPPASALDTLNTPGSLLRPNESPGNLLPSDQAPAPGEEGAAAGRPTPLTGN